MNELRQQITTLERQGGGSHIVEKIVHVEKSSKKKKDKKRKRSSSSSSSESRGERRRDFTETVTDTNMLVQMRESHQTELEEKTAYIEELQITIEGLHAEIDSLSNVDNTNGFAMAIEAKARQAKFEKNERRLTMELKEESRKLHLHIKQITEAEARIKTIEFRNREMEQKLHDGCKGECCYKTVQIEVIVPKLIERMVEVTKYVEKPT